MKALAVFNKDFVKVFDERLPSDHFLCVNGGNNIETLFETPEKVFAGMSWKSNKDGKTYTYKGDCLDPEDVKSQLDFAFDHLKQAIAKREELNNRKYSVTSKEVYEKIEEEESELDYKIPECEKDVRELSWVNAMCEIGTCYWYEDEMLIEM